MSNLKTCNFCNSIFKKAHGVRQSYCFSCPPTKGMPRYREKINDDHVNDYMKGVFESFIAEIETTPYFYGFLSFDKLYEYIKSHYKYLSESEYISLLKILTEYETRWSQYIDLVLNHSRYIEIASLGGGKKEFKTPSDWAFAIRNLLKILSDANILIKSRVSQLISQTAIQKKKKLCQKTSVTKCKHPCIVSEKLGIKKCNYKGL